jgi:hypothetical protein
LPHPGAELPQPVTIAIFPSSRLPDMAAIVLLRRCAIRAIDRSAIELLYTAEGSTSSQFHFGTARPLSHRPADVST